jgi:very-short-patch-repair endonuclease
MPHVSNSVFVVLFIIIIAAVVAAGLKGRVGDVWPFEKKHVLSEVEQKVYWRLLKAAPEFIVFAQVALSSIVDVKRGTRERRAHRNKIAQKSVDFALCHKDGSILVVIEVDDKTHLDAKRAETDRVKNKILEAAGIPILRWKASPLPSEESMRTDIAAFTVAPSLRVTPGDKLSRG